MESLTSLTDDNVTRGVIVGVAERFGDDVEDTSVVSLDKLTSLMLPFDEDMAVFMSTTISRSFVSSSLEA